MPWEKVKDEQDEFKDEFKDDDVSKIQLDISQVIRQWDEKLQKQDEVLNLNDIELTLHHIRDDYKSLIHNSRIYFGAKEHVTDNMLINVRNAYVHYSKLLLAHLVMVKKDVLTDTSSMFDISVRTLLLYVLYGENAFNLLFIKEKKQEEEEDDGICLHCSS